MLAVGLPAVFALSAIGGVTFLVGSGDDAVRTGEIATTTTTTTVPTDEFTAAGVTVEVATIATTATTVAPTTTTAATTVPAPTTTTTPIVVEVSLPAQPIDPPADPRGFEEQVQLGGISIPKLGVDEPLLEGIRLTTLDNGPGHWPGTAMPGDVGNVVVAAHRTSHGGPFRDIDQLVAGDAVVFTTDAGESEYTVTGTEIVNPDALWIVDPTDTATATLFACHPPGSTRQRIVVHLELTVRDQLRTPVSPPLS
ncbi:MAG: class E sortase [Ilumatobacter sp.]|uniref:class E sortase n=2 Tax=Ilumatobacter sp. TaxID=1967498 RepID=UPI003298B935